MSIWGTPDDPAVLPGAPGTISAKLRTISQQLGGPGALTDGSGAIASGGVSQQLFAAHQDRRLLLVQNVSPSGTLWVNIGAGASLGQGSFRLDPGGSLCHEHGFIPSGAVFATAAVSGIPYTAKQH